MHRRAALAVVLLLALMPSGALAAKPPARATPLPAGLEAAVSPPALESVCPLGITGPAVFSVDYVLPPNDAYFLRVRPLRCAGCPDSVGIWTSTLEITLDFPVPCSMPVALGLVAALGDSACAPPDPSHPMCTSDTTNLVAATAGIHTFTRTLVQPCAVTKNAYLRLIFLAEGAGCAGDGLRPRFVTTASCTLCVAYNYYASDSADLCALQLPGLPLISAVADSCFPRALLGVGHPGPPRFTLRVAPNPSSADVEIQLELPRAEEASVDVCDVAGRRVRTMFRGAAEAGTRSWRWDGRDERGDPVRAGVYFARVRTASGQSARTIVLQR